MSPVIGSRWEIVDIGRIDGVVDIGRTDGFFLVSGERIDWYTGSEGFMGRSIRRISFAEMEEPTRRIFCSHFFLISFFPYLLLMVSKK